MTRKTRSTAPAVCAGVLAFAASAFVGLRTLPTPPQSEFADAVSKAFEGQPNGGVRVVGLCEINGIMYAMRTLRNFKTNQCCYLTPLAKSGYIAVAGGEKNRYLPGKQYRILRKGKAVICA